MNLIALDIDGVLVSRWSLRQKKDPDPFDPVCVQAFNRIVRETEAKVVISSTWRKFFSWEALAAHFRENFVECEILGCTPDFSWPPLRKDPLGPRPWEPADDIRGREIASWIRTAGFSLDETRLCILDDDSDMGPLLPYLINTDTEIGLTEADADRAIALLKGDA